MVSLLSCFMFELKLHTCKSISLFKKKKFMIILFWFSPGIIAFFYP